MRDGTERRETQVWLEAGARPNWQSNMAEVSGLAGFYPQVAITRIPTFHRGLNRLAGAER